MAITATAATPTPIPAFAPVLSPPSPPPPLSVPPPLLPGVADPPVASGEREEVALATGFCDPVKVCFASAPLEGEERLPSVFPAAGGATGEPEALGWLGEARKLVMVFVVRREVRGVDWVAA
jgi:hypothetical protein